MSESGLINIDAMLAQVGDFGRYQWILMVLFSIINILSAFHYFGQTFISVVPEYKCKESPLKCYYGNGTKCSTGWDYNNSYGFISIVEEFNWICDDSWKPALGQSMFFVGSVMGSLIFGILADRIGRLHILVIANMFAFAGNLITLISKDLSMFAFCRFIAGCATDTNFVMMYIIVMEYIQPNMRTFGLNICIGVFYCVSCMMVPWVSVFLQHWKNLLVFVAMPHLIVLLFYLVVPESAQWLISKGRTEDAILCFKRIAQINKKEVHNKQFDALIRYCSQHIKTSNNESFLGLLKTPKLRRKIIILIFKSMVMTLCYDAISRNVNGLGYSPFIVFTITSSTILPACLFILAVQDRIGRKALASGSLLLSGIFTATSGIIQSLLYNPNPAIILSLQIVARLGVTVAYNSGSQYAVELIPTVVRGQGVSIIHLLGYGATFFSPQILYLANIWRPAPDVVLGVLLVFGAISCLFLPETLNKILPVTLQDGEQFGENEKFYEFVCCKKNDNRDLRGEENVGYVEN